MHIVSLGALGTPRAMAVAWWVNGGQLGISVHMCHQQHLMASRWALARRPLLTAQSSCLQQIAAQTSDLLLATQRSSKS